MKTISGRVAEAQNSVYVQGIYYEVLKLLSSYRLQEDLDVTYHIPSVAILFKNDNIHTRCACKVLNGFKHEIRFERLLQSFHADIDETCTPNNTVSFYMPANLRSVHNELLNEEQFKFSVKEKLVSAKDKTLQVFLQVPDENQLVDNSEQIELRVVL